MTNIANWKDSPFLRTVNHLFRLGPSKNHGELLVTPWPSLGHLWSAGKFRSFRRRNPFDDLVI